jgi:hypothetical protein
MSDQLPENSPRQEGEEPSSLDGDELTRLMRRALTSSSDAAGVDVLGGVQQRLRQRSGGKFYRDGWTTARHPPVATYLITALLMLAIVGITYAVLVPIEGVVEPVATPKPVQIIAP